MSQSSFRPFVTSPNGTDMLLPTIVRSDEDRQQVLNKVGAAVEQTLGTQALAIPPDRRGDYVAKVQFFRVAFG